MDSSKHRFERDMKPERHERFYVVATNKKKWNSICYGGGVYDKSIG